MSKYSSGLVSQSFWFVEVKKIISLLNSGALHALLTVIDECQRKNTIMKKIWKKYD